jgi:hypothetical protein
MVRISHHITIIYAVLKMAYSSVFLSRRLLYFAELFTAFFRWYIENPMLSA